ncbi:MAG: hypothetical protein QM771_18405 [Nitrospira sp.]
MNMWRDLTIAMMVMGTTLVPGVPSGAAQKEATEKTPKVEEETSDKSAGKASKDGRVIKKRRPSGKSNMEDTTAGKSQSQSQDSREGTPGTTLMFRSDGAGNSGATGK